MPIPHAACPYTFEQIRSSELLYSARLAEIDTAIHRRLYGPTLGDGRTLADGVIADFGPDGLQFFPLNHDGAREYMVRLLLPLVLTADELTLIKDKCAEGASAARRRRQFAAARKVPAAEYDGHLFSEQTDQHFQSTDELATDDFMVAEDGTRYAWATTPKQIIGRLTVSDAFENDIQNNGWEDMDHNDLHGVPELQAALDAFVEANKGVVAYHADYSTAVIFSVS